MYKKKLEFPENENIKIQQEQLEEQLNLANIVMARVQAKMEVSQETMILHYRILVIVERSQRAYTLEYSTFYFF